MIFNISSNTGGGIGIEVDPRVGKPSHFVFSLHKSGSVLLNAMVQELAREAGEPFVDVPGELFAKGLPLEDVKKESFNGLFQVEGVCFGGFRQWPRQFELVLPEKSRCVLLVRDPRDILVSLYFSMVKSHPLPESGEVRDRLEHDRRQALEIDIDGYAMKLADFVLEVFTDYQNALCRSSQVPLKIFQYEDVIFRKVEWMTELTDWFGWVVPNETIEEVARRYDIRPEREDPDQHIRKVTPGDHREKLKPATIKTLNEMFQTAVLPFGYDLMRSR